MSSSEQAISSECRECTYLTSSSCNTSTCEPTILSVRLTANTLNRSLRGSMLRITVHSEYGSHREQSMAIRAGECVPCDDRDSIAIMKTTTNQTQYRLGKGIVAVVARPMAVDAAPSHQEACRE